MRARSAIGLRSAHRASPRLLPSNTTAATRTPDSSSMKWAMTIGGTLSQQPPSFRWHSGTGGFLGWLSPRPMVMTPGMAAVSSWGMISVYTPTGGTGTRSLPPSVVPTAACTTGMSRSSASDAASGTRSWPSVVDPCCAADMSASGAFGAGEHPRGNAPSRDAPSWLAGGPEPAKLAGCSGAGRVAGPPVVAFPARLSAGYGSCTKRRCGRAWGCSGGWASEEALAARDCCGNVELGSRIGGSGRTAVGLGWLGVGEALGASDAVGAGKWGSGGRSGGWTVSIAARG
mmetsp:Transcript_37001/g.114276  ORF Transcript_37001/g.114276 Transcript_37001/m.114276 type:complete len:287 (-) Transcript_37001:690-1550(-)